MARYDYPSSPFPTPFASGSAVGRKFFTVVEATRALPLVKRIALDIQNSQQQRLELNRQLNDRLGLNPPLTQRQRERLEDQLELETEHFGNLVEELEQVGVETKDPLGGLVDFPALHEGRPVYLCWRVGEPEIGYWHEMDTGFNSRRPIAELMVPPAV